jgi:protein MAK11
MRRKRFWKKIFWMNGRKMSTNNKTSSSKRLRSIESNNGDDVKQQQQQRHNHLIIVGCYDGHVCGWESATTIINETHNKVGIFHPTFSFKAHDSCVRGIDLSTNKTNLVTCSTDETLQIYDLNRKIIIDRCAGAHRADVTAVSFISSATNNNSTKNNNNNNTLDDILSGDADGTIYYWKNNQVLTTLKGHKPSKVTSIAIHPSHRLALTTGMDNSLRMWDLVHGKPAPRKKLEDFTIISCACWAPDGSRYAILGNDCIVVVFDTIDDAISGIYKHEKRVNSIRFVEDVIIASASDDGFVRFIGADGSQVRKFDCRRNNNNSSSSIINTSRIKDIGILRDHHSNQPSHLVALSSDGCIHVFDIHDDNEMTLPIQVIEFEGRGTCMTCI